MGMRRTLTALLLVASTLSFAVFAVAAEPDDAALLPDNAPQFTAKLIVDETSYAVLGIFPDLPTDAVLVRPMYSTDGVNYGDNDDYYDWVLPKLGADEETLAGLRSQLCARGMPGEPLDEYLNGEAAELWFKLQVTMENGASYDTQAALVTRESAPPPESPPTFSTEVQHSNQGTSLVGRFEAFTTDIQKIEPIYSLDGKGFHADPGKAWELSLWNDENKSRGLFRQTCFTSSDEPFRSYLNGSLEQFYVKLRITTWSGGSYESEAALVRRGAPQPVPDGVRLGAMYAGGMRVPRQRCNKAYVTAREGMPWAEVEPLLPTSLPVDIQLLTKNLEIIDRGLAQGAATWRPQEDLTLTASDKSVVFEDALASLDIPQGYEVPMATGRYQLLERPTFDPLCGEAVQLWVNLLKQDARASLGLNADLGGTAGIDLHMAFDQKPSGAKAIRYFYYYEGLEDWVEAGEVLEQAPVDVQPGNEASVYYKLFSTEDGPYGAYLAGKLDGFLVGVEIEGGVFDGELHQLAWPGEYETPARVPEFGGSGGNRGDAGSGDGGGNGDGQRPGLPGGDGGTTEGTPPTGPGASGGETNPPVKAPPEMEQPMEEGTPPPEENLLPAAEAPPQDTAAESPGGQVLSPGGSGGTLSSPLPAAPDAAERLQEESTPEETETRTDTTAAPRGTDAAAPQQTPDQPRQEASAVSQAVTAAVVVLGGGAAVAVGLGAVGAASGSAGGASGMGKVLQVLRKLLRR